MGEVSIRSARASDLEALTRIYNHYVETTPVTFDVTPFSVEQRRGWFEHYAGRGPYRLLVAELDGEPAGYASSSRFRDKRAYDPTVETTVYLRPDRVGRGIGTQLYAELFERLAGEEVHRAVAGVTLPNPVSLALHRRFGFEPVGTFDEVGFKLSRYWSVQWLEKRLTRR